MDASIRWPLVANRIRKSSESNTFGIVRRHADGTPKAHQGWDFYAALGTTCYAIGAGKIVYSDHNGDFGLLTIASFSFQGQELFAAYAHLGRSLVRLHQNVDLATPIGETGKSGNASTLTGDDLHLHFEIRRVKLPGLGLSGRMSPVRVFDVCPLQRTIFCPSPAAGFLPIPLPGFADGMGLKRTR